MKWNRKRQGIHLYTFGEKVGAFTYPKGAIPDHVYPDGRWSWGPGGGRGDSPGHFNRPSMDQAMCFITLGWLYGFKAGWDPVWQAWFKEKAWRRPLPPFTGTAVFTIAVDGREVFNSGPMTMAGEPVLATVDLAGAKEFELQVRTGEDLPHFAWAGWGEAVATLADGRNLRLSTMPVTEPEARWRQRAVVVAWGLAKPCPAVGRIEISGGVLGPIRAGDAQVVVIGGPAASATSEKFKETPNYKGAIPNETTHPDPGHRWPCV